MLDNFGESKLKGQHTHVFNNSMAGKCIAVRAHVVDTNGCEGPEFNQTMIIHNSDNEKKLAIDLNYHKPVSFDILIQ